MATLEGFSDFIDHITGGNASVTRSGHSFDALSSSVAGPRFQFFSFSGTLHLNSKSPRDFSSTSPTATIFSQELLDHAKAFEKL